MDEIEHIFPEDPRRVAEPVSDIYNGQSARAALTAHCGSLHQREKNLRQELADLSPWKRDRPA